MSDRLARLFREFAAQQRLPEYLAVARRLRDRLGLLNVVIEVGSSSGGTLALWAELAAPDGLLVSVDLPQGPGEAFTDEALRRAAGGRRLVPVRADSASPRARTAVAEALGTRRADLLFLDGGHQAATVRSDFRTYAPWVRDGGIVALHDIVRHPPRPDVRVHELWWELKARFPGSAEEIFEARDQDWGGIGLLAMGPQMRLYAAGPEPVPVFINNFNRLQSTRRLADWASGLATARVVILDNDSDWDPLLAWYEACPYEVRRLGANLGQRAPWTSGAVAGVATPHYVVTDPDLDLRSCPADVLDVLAEGLRLHPWATKAGVGLEIEDIPAEYPSRELVCAIESRYWQARLDGRFFRADVDTTFALYRAGEDPPCGPALRADRPYVARHLPWYVTPGTLDEEERHYLRTADPRFSSGTAHTRGAYGL
jgi:predicted O-methyltransferase YrrM